MPGIPPENQRKGLQDKNVDHQAVDWFDGAMNAFRTDILQDTEFLPYDSSFDHQSWWVSQFFLILKANILYRQKIIQLNTLKVKNTQHGTSASYVSGHDGFVEAFNKVKQTFGLETITMTGKPV
ncbi:hypothetical protein [Parvularcula sp. IMCC14364]|uniref:hypothetical protein n=1 Tax=Parvularcula sp. IMCC14364 TaxID=3067902 RepID=UPI002741DE72|nr:hypothetical protein [Parvularcula sp. IMCC14364]